MLLEWPEHSKKLIEGVNSLHTNFAAFHDVTLSAEGKQIKAHRVILAAASTYFKELLLSESQNEDRFPIVFLKDVKHLDLECLVKYIYTGKTEVNAANMASCMSLAETLGVTGFAEKLKNLTSPSKKRKSTDLNKENISLALSPRKTCSEPVYMNMPELLKQSEQIIKRRKIHSLDNVVTPPPAFVSPKSIQIAKKLSFNSSESVITKKSPFNSPVKKSHNHSCPVESPVTATSRTMGSASATASSATLPRASMINNVNFNSILPLMSPEELAFQGASILQSLALWMEQEQKREIKTETVVPSHVHQHSGHSGPPPPPPPNSLKSNPGSSTTMTSERLRHTSGSRRLGPGDSESGDRPDSGFDSKDEEEVKTASMVHQLQFSEAISEEAGIRTASSGDTSPDLAVEISRQAPIRQPVVRKRRLNH